MTLARALYRVTKNKNSPFDIVLNEDGVIVSSEGVTRCDLNFKQEGVASVNISSSVEPTWFTLQQPIVSEGVSTKAIRVDLVDTLQNPGRYEVDVFVFDAVSTSGRYAGTIDVEIDGPLSTPLGALPMDLFGNLRLPEDTPAAITADQNDYAPGTNAHQRLSSDAEHTITGLAFIANGVFKLLSNVGTNNIVLAHQNVASLAANRIITNTGIDVILHPEETILLLYDGVTARWRMPPPTPPYYRKIDEEITAGVTIVDFYKKPVNALRYGKNTVPGTTDMLAAFDAMVAVAKQMTAPHLIIPAGDYFVSAEVQFDVPDNSTIDFYGTVKTDLSAATALLFGDSTSLTIGLTVNGIRVRRTTNDSAGTSIGVETRNLWSSEVHVVRSTGFADGVLLNGNFGGNRHCRVFLDHIEDNQNNVRLTASGTGDCNENNIYGGNLNHRSSYPDVATTNLTIDHNTDGDAHTLNNNRFWGPSFQDIEAGTASNRVAAVINGENNVIYEPRMERLTAALDNSTPTYEIQFTVNALECAVRGRGFSLVRTNINDLGANSIYETREGVFESYQVEAPAVAIPVVGDPAAHRGQSTSSVLGIIYSCLDSGGVLRYAVDGSGNVYSNAKGFFNTGLRWSTTDGSLNDRGLFVGTGSPEGVVTAEPGSLYCNKSGGAGTTTYEKISGSGNTGWQNLGRPVSTTTNLEDVSNLINTSADKIEGYQVFDSTAKIPMYATGNADGSTWVGEKAGSTITLTPV